MTRFKRVISISAGLSLLILLFVGNLLGILADKQEDAVQYYVVAGNVGIDLMAGTGTEDAIEIAPNAVTPLKTVVEFSHIKKIPKVRITMSVNGVVVKDGLTYVLVT